MINLKLAIRHLLKDKFFVTVNLVGLTIAMAVALVIFAFVRYHNSFDRHVGGFDRTYRIISRIDNGTFWASTFSAFDKALKDQPEIETYTTFYKNDEQFDLLAREKQVRITDPVYGDSRFLKFFKINLKSGDVSSIEEPNTVLLSESTSRNLFGDENPVGKMVQVKYNVQEEAQNRNCRVGGVWEENQENSHLKYDLIFSKFGHYEQTLNQIDRMKVYGAYVFLTLYDNTDVEALTGRFNSLLKPLIGDAQGPPLEAFESRLQPLREVHFSPGMIRDISVAVRQSHLNILLIVGLLLFMTALFNFLVMDVTIRESNQKQSRIMQIMGSSRSRIWLYHLWRVKILVLIGAFLAIMIILFSSGLISDFFVGWTVDFGNAAFWGHVLVLSVLVILVAGVSDLRNVFKREKALSTDGMKSLFPLLLFQFAIVAGLIAFGLLLNKQIDFIRDKDLGYNPENVAIIRVSGPRNEKIKVLKEEVLKIPGVEHAATAQHYPGFRLQDLNLETDNQNIPFKFAMVGPDVMKTLDIKVKDTFNSNKDFSILINESFYNTLRQSYSHEDIVSGNFPGADSDSPEKIDFFVSGVVEDFHYNSLYSEVGNFAFFVQGLTDTFHRFLLVKYDDGKEQQVMEGIGKAFASIYPGPTFEPIFLDEQLRLQYESEERLLSVTGWFAILTVLIAVTGLFAYSGYSVRRRTKEIGIRKVNGALVSQVVWLLNKGLLRWVAISFFLAVPFTLWGMTEWLKNFAYHTSVSWWIFFLTGLIVFAIAVFTVSWNSWRAAIRNPVEALRDE
ncbi:ABC transporter permease [Marinilabilia sp.]|uniref:ABC transporter permease n=1 Tax=Marinilabilia sp. TaxID=2021252 RepID=UPI0025BBF9A5|nr:ABC transporter permease [Marinilabilia sp.]